MKKNILWFITLLLPFMGLVSSCSEEDIVFDHEKPCFETVEGKILLEVILPQATTTSEEVYIVGAFNGGEAEAVGNEQWKLVRTDLTTLKRGIYLDPSDFLPGTSLTDGFYFVSDKQREEVTINGEAVVRTDNPSVGTRTDIKVDRWAAYFDNPDAEIEHDGFAVFVEDNSGWGDDLRLYAWGSGLPELYGGWPGAAATGTQIINGVSYKYFDTGKDNEGLTYNLIFNNNGQGSQFDAVQGYTLDHDLYLRITDSGYEEIELEPSVKHDGFAVFVIDKTGWDGPLTLYMWGDVNNLNGDWPGMQATGEQTIKGINYQYFDMGADNTGLAENLIFSNNGSSQLADFAFTIERDIYLEVSTTGVVEIDPDTYDGGDNPPTPTLDYKIYIQNLTGWGSTAMYAWGTSEIFGAWPGTAASVETIGGVEYQVFTLSAEGSYNLILNNGVGDAQVNGPEVTADRDYYFSVSLDGWSEIPMLSTVRRR